MPANGAEESGTRSPIWVIRWIFQNRKRLLLLYWTSNRSQIDEASAALSKAEVESEEVEDNDEHSYGRIGGLRARGDDELLRLFQEIETQGSDEVDAPIEVGDLIDIDAEEERQRITTPTLAEIYTIQGLTQKAIETYRELLDQDPNNDFIRRKLEELESSGSKK